ncbi:MAG: RNA polymerase sigma-70 factor [Bacteroidales bacterium]|nr:RNA polymerase sigma-70 factor [Bacteroidales bacterium]
MYNSKEQLLIDLNDKKIEAYEELFFKYHGRLVLFARKFTGDLQSAQDIVQDAFLIIWEKSDTLSINSSPKAYLFQAVKNSCLNYIRHLNTCQTTEDKLNLKISLSEKSVYSDFNDPYYSLLELEIQQKIEEIINTLPEKCLEVYKLSRQNNLHNKEIAEKLGISVKMVEKHISKALSVLKSELSEYIGVFLIFLIINL